MGVLCRPRNTNVLAKHMKYNSIVLLVENNPDDARLAELAFEKSKTPHALFIVSDAVEATRYLKGFGRYGDRQRFPFPRLILLDLGLPGMSGFEFLEQLRKDPHTRSLSVTVLSGSDYLRDVTRAYQLGANSFLVKPSDLGKFAEAIRDTIGFWLEGKSGSSRSAFLQAHNPLARSKDTKVDA